jgi:hypothetical protein
MAPGIPEIASFFVKHWTASMYALLSGTECILSYHSILFGGFVHDPEELVTGTAAAVDSWAKPNTTGRRFDRCMFSSADNKAQLCYATIGRSPGRGQSSRIQLSQILAAGSCGEDPEFCKCVFI